MTYARLPAPNRILGQFQSNVFFTISDQSYLLPKEFQTIWSIHEEFLNNPICSPRNSACFLKEFWPTPTHLQGNSGWSCLFMKVLWSILAASLEILDNLTCLWRNAGQSYPITREFSPVWSALQGILTNHLNSPTTFLNQPPTFIYPAGK